MIRNDANRPAKGKAAKRGYSMAAKDDVGEIFIFDTIGDPWDGTTAKQFAKDLKGLGPVKQLDIFVNSPGGSVFDGVAIFNQLQRHKARKVVQIDGIAASIASVIAMAGDEIAIAANGMMMIHEPWTFAFGSGPELRKIADSLDKISGSIRGTYVTRTGGDEETIAAQMLAETWFDAKEAVEQGFADTISDEVLIAAHFDLSKYKNVPKSLAKAPTLRPRAGQNLARRLNERIADLVTEDRSEEDVVAEMASEAGIDVSTVRQILREEIDCPPLDRLEGFARALDVSADSLQRVAESDGCNYDEPEESARARTLQLVRMKHKARRIDVSRKAQ
jgi:ATP-dependent Clp protease protease subunit